MQAIFYSVDDEGDSHRIGTVATDATGENAIIPPELDWCFKNFNVIEPNTLELLDASDGERFVRALPNAFHGTRLFAVAEAQPLAFNEKQLLAHSLDEKKARGMWGARYDNDSTIQIGESDGTMHHVILDKDDPIASYSAIRAMIDEAEMKQVVHIDE